jgi:hypothetical protein
VEVDARTIAIGAVDRQPHLYPRTVPAEAIVESEPLDWWTTGRRVRIGREVADAARAALSPIAADAALQLADLPVPYEALNGTGFDGRRLWQRRNELQLQDEWFGTPSPPAVEPVDLWDPAELGYTASLPVGNATLVIDRHEGGDLDWFSADAASAIDVTAGERIQTKKSLRVQRFGGWDSRATGKLLVLYDKQRKEALGSRGTVGGTKGLDAVAGPVSLNYKPILKGTAIAPCQTAGFAIARTQQSR